MAWAKAGSTTLASAGDDLDVTFTASKFNQLMVHLVQSADASMFMNFENNSSTDYAYRHSANGSEQTEVNQTKLNWTGSLNQINQNFMVMNIMNISGEDKLGIGFVVSQTSAGAGNAPSRKEYYVKFDTTTDSGQITRVDFHSSATNAIPAGSNVSVLGSDLTPSAGRPTDVQVGSRFEETDTRKMYHYADLTYGGFPKFWAEEGVAIGTYPPTRGVWASGYTNTPSNQALNTIDYVTIASHTGTATDFGDMTGSRASSSGASSYTRGVIAGGSSSIANIEFITIMTKSNASNFGDLTVARENVATVTDRSRGMWIAGGDSGSTVIDYVTISTLADATSFGTLSTARRLAQGVNDATIGLVAGGYISSAVSSVLKFTIQTLGNGTSFGSLSSDRYNVATVSSQTRGVWAGGQAGVNTDMDYRTIAGTSATATVFGSLGTAQTGANGNSDLTRGVIAGGWVTSLMQVMTIDTGSGGATTYGNLSLARDHPAGALEG